MNNLLSSIEGPFTPRQTVSANPCALIIEDDDDSRYLMKILLEMRGFRTLAVEDGEQGMALIEKTSPDLIIMNITLPVHTGLEMLRQIHENPLLQKVPIIVTSGYVVRSFQQETLQAGGIRFLAKPIDPTELDNAIKRCLPHQGDGH